MLGVCLGHQGLAHVRGGTRRARRRASSTGASARSSIAATGSSPASRRAFAPSATTRSSSSPRCRPSSRRSPGPTTARSWRSAHRGRRAWGVQFHPESVGTEHGERLIANFLALTPPRAGAPRAPPRAAHDAPCPAAARRCAPAAPSHVAHRVLDGAPDAERAFAALFGDREHAFWLDSSLVDPQLSRFSFMGAAIGELGAEIRYRVARAARDRHPRRRDRASTTRRCFAYLSRELARLHTADAPSCRSTSTAASSATSATSCKADCGARRRAPRRAARRVPAARRPHRRDRPRARRARTCSRCRRGRRRAGGARALARRDRRRARDGCPRSPSRRRAPASAPRRRVRARRAAASTTWPTSRPASACSRPARATRSA